MNLIEIENLIPECCNIAVVDINKCHEKERRSLDKILPSVKSIIVLAHHIKNSQEWVWTQMESERGNTTCIADLHTKDILKNIKKEFESKNFNSELIPYPGVSGIRFKKLAEKTILGEIGDNFLFLHHEWGPWVHLRVLLTDLKIKNSQENLFEQVCIHCEKCIQACPVDALTQNDFNIKECKKRHEKLESSHSCEICARACPIGENPD